MEYRKCPYFESLCKCNPNINNKCHFDFRNCLAYSSITKDLQKFAEATQNDDLGELADQLAGELV